MHLWILPNLTEDVGFFDSFKPLYTYKFITKEDKENEKKKKEEKQKKKKKQEQEANDSESEVNDKNEDQGEGQEEEGGEEEQNGDQEFELVDREDLEEEQEEEDEEEQGEEGEETEEGEGNVTEEEDKKTKWRLSGELAQRGASEIKDCQNEKLVDIKTRRHFCQQKYICIKKNKKIMECMMHRIFFKVDLWLWIYFIVTEFKIILFEINVWL